jgi:Peptidase family M28
VTSHRIYRAGFAPALAAVVVLLFALTAPPDPLPTVVAPAEFDDVAAARIARQIVDSAPDRTPGSEGDAATADMVERAFQQATEGEVAEQRFSAEWRGADVELRNVILTLPGESARSVVIMAPRDSASVPGAASSAASTAMLLELVNEIRSQTHTKTLVFVSTDGSVDGALGAREFAQHYPQRGEIDAVIDLWQPGYAHPRPPFVLDASAGAQSPSAQLVRTAQRDLSDQTPYRATGEGMFGELTGLALPSGLSEQAVLVENGLDAVGLSSAGERSLPASQDQPEDFSSSTLGDFGRTALVLAATIDGATSAPEHGPGTYVTLAGNLVPGWTLALIALALLLPAALASADSIRRAARAHARVGRGLAWATSRAMPLLVALLLFYFCGLVGIVARPEFPFDPNLFGVGVGQIVVMVLLALVVGGGYYAIRGWRVPAGLPVSVAVPTLGLVAVLAVFLAWLANPYLALLLVPVAHVWLTCTLRRGPLPWPLVVGAAVVSLLPIAAAIDHTSGALALGADAPWLLLLMVGDGQFGFVTMLALCLLIGSLVGLVAVSLRGARAPRLDTSPIVSLDPDDDLRRES